MDQRVLLKKSFKLFTLSLNDSSGSSVFKRIRKKLMKIANKVYSITNQSDTSLKFIVSMNHS